MSGKKTINENIADSGGVKLAYAAYQTFARKNGPEPILPGLNYTANQLFWISVAQTSCAITRSEFDTTQYLTDFHAPNEFRVIGSLGNAKEFSDDFACAPGTKMNPVKKCTIW